jgi:histidinol-phosphate aminotransferase
VASEDCIKLLQRVRQPFNTTAMAQVAAIAALDDDEFVDRTRAMTHEGVAYLQAMFSKMKLDYVPTFANFIMVKVGPGRKIFDAMQRAGVIVRPMDPYGLPEYIRITIGTRAENKRCVSVLKKVLKEA